MISPLPLDFSGDAEYILRCLVAFPDAPNEFSNVFGCGFVALDPQCGGFPALVVRVVFLSRSLAPV